MTASPVYEASPIKRTRATKTEVEARREALLDIVEVGRPMTVRQVFYQATVRGLVEKAESGYAKVQVDLTKMRRARRQHAVAAQAAHVRQRRIRRQIGTRHRPGADSGAGQTLASRPRRKRPPPRRSGRSAPAARRRPRRSAGTGRSSRARCGSAAARRQGLGGPSYGSHRV